MRAVGSPEGRFNEHLSEKVAVSRTSGTDADSHTGRVPQPRPLDEELIHHVRGLNYARW